MMTITTRSSSSVKPRTDARARGKRQDTVEGTGDILVFIRGLCGHIHARTVVVPFRPVECRGLYFLQMTVRLRNRHIRVIGLSLAQTGTAITGARFPPIQADGHCRMYDKT